LDDAYSSPPQFLAGAKSIRANTVNAIRRNAPNIFALNVKSSAVYAKDYDRSQVPAIAAQLRNPKYPNEGYPRYCTVLYKDGVITGHGLFGGVAIRNVGKQLPRFQYLTTPADPQGDPSWRVINHTGFWCGALGSCGPCLPYRPQVDYSWAHRNGRDSCKGSPHTCISPNGLFLGSFYSFNRH
jgi:hypothetical protein